ncbi:hypothetical protein SAMN05216420_11395 [Nitrosospira sp. Nl5]|nr:hypothetical protein SAMN05216420_11395 [Nitrosospira sp. Nl5]
MLAMAASGFLASLILGALIAWLLIELVNTRMPLEIIGVGFFLVVLNWALALVNIVLAGLLAGWRYWSA